MKAQYRGKCGECGTTIHPDTEIRSLPFDGWAHAVCPDDPSVSLRPTETVCPEHFIVRPCPDCED